MSAIFDPQPGDVWHDVCPSLTGGTIWHARADENGKVELFQPNGPGRVPAYAIPGMRGGLTLLRRGDDPICAHCETGPRSAPDGEQRHDVLCPIGVGRRVDTVWREQTAVRRPFAGGESR